MTLTLTANITAADRYLSVTGTVPDDIEPTYRFRLGNELLELQAFVVVRREVGKAGNVTDRNQWYVLRGLDTSDGASHTAGDEILGATDAYAAATSGTTPPSPFASGGGGGLPTGWTQDPETGLVDTGGQDFTGSTITGFSLTGPLQTGGGDIDTGGGGIDTDSGAIVTGGGSLDTEGGSLDTTGGPITTGAGSVTTAQLKGTSNALIIGDSNDLIGFFNGTAAARPEVPAVPIAQDVVDALVALGLITQTPP